MNSLRPLITITILAVVGGWLYLQINKGPARPDEGDPAAWQGQAADGVPPLATTTTAPQTTDTGSASTWPDAPSTAPPAFAPQSAPTTIQPAPTASNSNGLPDMPAIPELPDVPKPSQTAPPATATNATTVTLPTNIPTARYPEAGDAAATGAAAPLNARSQLPPTNPASAEANSIGGSPVAAQSTDDHENSVATDSAMAAAGFTPQMRSTVPSPGDANQPTVQQPAPGADRYGLGATNATAPAPPAAAMPPVEPTFATAWPEIQAALDRGELARGHQLLTKWYGDDSLTPAEAGKVDTLLGQLAGTVVYSNEHQLEPAYVVQPGQNLEAIAKDFNVPWQLLAKINGIPSTYAVQPGQKLKVVRGPFSAVVDLRRSQLSLFVDGRYAGKFPISVPAETAVTEGKWLVDQKLAAPGANATQAPYTPSTEPTIVLRGEDPSTGKPAATGPALTIASSSPSSVPSNGAPAIRISPQDAEELSDILSIGSRVTVRK